MRLLDAIPMVLWDVSGLNWDYFAKKLRLMVRVAKIFINFAAQ